MLFKTIAKLLYPENIKCICCGSELNRDTEYCLCDDCSFAENNEFCLKCGRHIENLSNYCDICTNKKWEFDSARSAFLFDGDLKKVLHNFKFGNSGYLGEYFAKFMYNMYLSSFFAADLITFVPIHKSRRRKRGYNQSELIAKELANLLDLPCGTTLEKTTKTKPLSKLKANERVGAIKGSISFAAGMSVIKDKKILLVDDMFTTGATANECAKILKSGGAESVFVLTAASAVVKPLLY